jgi:hypothetical protein
MTAQQPATSVQDVSDNILLTFYEISVEQVIAVWRTDDLNVFRSAVQQREHYRAEIERRLAAVPISHHPARLTDEGVGYQIGGEEVSP